MKKFKLAKKTFLAIVISTFLGSTGIAETIDVSKSKKDILVMARVIETSLEASNSNFPGTPRISGTYLAHQGYLFNIQLNGISSFGFPGIASWDRGRLELDLPELITEVLATIDTKETLNVAPESIISTVDSLYADEDLQETLKVLREKQRDIRREDYQLHRDIRKTEAESERNDLEKKLESNRQLLKKYTQEYSDSLASFKTERTSRRVKKSTDATNAIFSTICDYGQTMRALKKNEKVTLMIKGGLGEDGTKATQVYVINQADLKKCSDSVKLKKNAIHYSL
jgi:Skp family chaperone for outer membrane proteins